MQRHRYYYSVLPCQNRLLQMQYDEAAYKRHREELKRVKAMVDTKPPQTYIHLHLKPKKLQLEEERLAIIERDNRILLEKMSMIMRTGGRIDNVNNYMTKSLNRSKRQRELLRVTRENKAMMERILQKSMGPSELDWKKDWQMNLSYMDNISRFPKGWWEKEKTQTRSSESQSGRRKDDGKQSTERQQEQQQEQQRSADDDNAPEQQKKE
ncbi:hypothetical protein BOX15_Mlig014779g2 [Macrostomum lignano]|uniref:Uncharacterized protein n=2 Tax=Macrostomum lignano TaxID=282301 RepID=A0A267GCR8_9PLAT|nr:hypothetical protein BOX15_Mlig014779g2 [Macrostomum lignano]